MSANPRDTVVVHSSWWELAIGSVVTAAMTLVCAVFGVKVIGSMSFSHPVHAGILGFVAFLAVLAGIGFAVTTGVNVHQLITNRPLFRLDANGVEWCDGRLMWDSVVSVELVGYRGDEAVNEWFSLGLRPGAELLPLGPASYEGGSVGDHVPRRVEGGIEIPVWTRTKDAIIAMQDLSGYAVSDEISVHEQPSLIF